MILMLHRHVWSTHHSHWWHAITRRRHAGHRMHSRHHLHWHRITWNRHPPGRHARRRISLRMTCGVRMTWWEPTVVHGDDAITRWVPTRRLHGICGCNCPISSNVKTMRRQDSAEFSQNPVVQPEIFFSIRLREQRDDVLNPC